jgi:hypothetical protein
MCEGNDEEGAKVKFFSEAKVRLPRATGQVMLLLPLYSKGHEISSYCLLPH